MKVFKLLFLVVITVCYGGLVASGIPIMKGNITGIASYLLIPGIFLCGSGRMD